jgi:ribosomal protein S18 acetylase RimI-like enzyme
MKCMPGHIFTIRRATESDDASILACLAEAFAPYRDSYTQKVFLDTVLTRQTLKHRMKKMTLFRAAQESSGCIVGTVACNLVSPHEGHLRGMAVLTSWQSTDVAQQLLQHVENHLRAQGCTRITLDTTEPLKRAIRFYERNGFRSSGRVTDFFGMALYEYVKP